ncbi:MAG: hypothetical protein H0X40_11150 [Chthoniobacterales bacterium]|nr:hypothetical protein [Chthoniobacterales bacterium]
MRFKLFIAIALFFDAGICRAPGDVKAHSVSTSRQFIVFGTEVGVRGAMCDLAERTKADLLQIFALPDAWKTPLIINLDYPQANLPELLPAHLDFSQIGSGLKLQLNLLVTGDLNGREVQRELLRAILLEMIYRSRPNVAAGTPYTTPPDWLVDGVLQLAPGHDSDEAAQLLASLVVADKISPLEEVVRQKRDLLDPASRKMHDAYAMALVQLLLDSPDGRRNVVHYLNDLPDAPNDAMADLQAHFPSVLGAASGRWWALSVARLSATDRYRILSAEETSKQVERLLRIFIPGPDGKGKDYALNEYARYLKLPASRRALLEASQEFLVLSARAHPSYRLIVQEYYALTSLLARGKTKRVSARLERVAGYRAAVDGQGRDIDDYVNWFEATQLKTMSGAFSEVLKAASEEENGPPRRRDAISVYLDSIEASL